MRGTYLDSEILDSPAFRSLKPAAMKIYIGLRRRRKMKNQGNKRRPDWKTTNPRELIYTYDRIAKEWEIKSTRTIADAWDDLIEKGLVDIVQTGSGRFKATTIYAISDRWENWYPNKNLRDCRGFEEKSRPRRGGNLGFGRKQTENPQLQKTTVAKPISAVGKHSGSPEASVGNCSDSLGSNSRESPSMNNDLPAKSS